MKKVCYECGKREDILFEGRCSKCFSKQVPPVCEIREVGFKVCNQCKRICYKNRYYDRDEFERRLGKIMKGQVVMNKGYRLNEVKVENFDVCGEKVCFDLVVDFDLV